MPLLPSYLLTDLIMRGRLLLPKATVPRDDPECSRSEALLTSAAKACDNASFELPAVHRHGAWQHLNALRALVESGCLGVSFDRAATSILPPTAHLEYQRCKMLYLAMLCSRRTFCKTSWHCDLCRCVSAGVAASIAACMAGCQVGVLAGLGFLVCCGNQWLLFPKRKDSSPGLPAGVRKRPAGSGSTREFSGTQPSYGAGSLHQPSKPGSEPGELHDANIHAAQQAGVTLASDASTCQAKDWEDHVPADRYHLFELRLIWSCSESFGSLRKPSEAELSSFPGCPLVLPKLLHVLPKLDASIRPTSTFLGCQPVLPKLFQQCYQNWAPRYQIYPTCY